MSKIQNIPFELTLERLYKELYNNPYPILSSRKQAILQVDFLGRFFPDRFYQDSARTENAEGNPWGKRWSNRNMRSAVWNGMYQSSSASRPNVFYRTIPDMIRRFPSSDFWRETLEKCDRLIANAPQTNLNRLRTFFEETVVNSFNQKLNSKEWNAYPDSCDIAAFQDYLKEHASSRPGLVLASVVLVALMGNMPSQALFEDMKSCVPSTEELAQIRNYLMPCGKQIRRSVWPGTQPPAPDAYADILKKYYDSYDTLYRCNTKVVRIAGDRRNILFEPTAEAAVPNDTTGSMHKLHLLDLLYENAILNKESLVISGAPGTEKHGLLHMLFLRLVSETLNGDRVDYAPYLCNLWHYTALTGKSDQKINAALKKDISAFLDFCMHSDRIPVVFIDGVKQYDIPGDLHLDYVLKESFSSLENAIYLFDREDLREQFQRRPRVAAQFDEGDCHLFVEIDSVPLRDNSPSDKFPEESKRSRTDIYLDTYCKLFPCGESLTPKTLLVGLTDLGFDRIDTGLLRLLAHPLSNQAGNPDPPNEENSVRLLTLYRNICDSFFSSDTDKLNEAAEWVYRFSLMSGENCMIENHFRKAQVFLCTHESILDYMTARHHLSLLLDSNPEKNAIAMSHVLPRSIMRFFVAMVNENAGKKEKILKQLLNQLELDLPSDLDEKKEDFLACIQMIPAKRASQLLYLLGRVETDGAQTALEKCYHLLRLCVARLQKNKKHLELSRSAEYKTLLYLLRSATVGLISRGIHTVRISNNTFEDLTEEDNSLSNAPSPEFAVQYPVWDDYLDLLITDGSANEINRAFYLEYYEDVPVDPSANAVSFSDNLEKGRHAIEHLLSATLIRKSHQANATHSYRLNLFSLVSLLQARTEDPTRQDYYPLDNYVSAALDRITFFTKHAHKIENEENHSGRFTKSLLDQFMCMVEADFKWWLDTSPSDRRPITAQLYSRYSTQVIRQNWTWDWNLAQQKAEKTTRNTVEPDPAAVHEAQTLMSGTSPVPVHPESVAEHQLRDWLIAMFYLPEHYEAERPRQYSTDSVYKKAKILKLLLIHDLSEAVVGNRARLRKNRTSQEIERKEMMSLLLHCSYPSLSGSTLVEYLKIWPAWIDYEEPKNQNNPRQYRDINGDIAYQIDCIQELYQLLTYYSADQISIPLNKLREWVISDARRIRSAPCKQIAKLLILRDPRLRKILDNNQLTKFLE